MVMSASVWLYTLTMSPYSPLTMFIPQLTPPEQNWIDNIRNFVQWDHVFCFGTALLWLGYLFSDLKHAGMVQQSWFRIVASAALTTVALGPGVAVGLGWLWREDVLANKRHKGAVIMEREGHKETMTNGHAVKQNSFVKH